MKKEDIIVLTLIFGMLAIVAYQAYWNTTLEGRKANAVVDGRIACAVHVLSGANTCDN